MLGFRASSRSLTLKNMHYDKSKHYSQPLLASCKLGSIWWPSEKAMHSGSNVASAHLCLFTLLASSDFSIPVGCFREHCHVSPSLASFLMGNLWGDGQIEWSRQVYSAGLRLFAEQCNTFTFSIAANASCAKGGKVQFWLLFLIPKQKSSFKAGKC